MPSDVERHLENRKKNQEFAAIVRTAVGADYSHRRPPTKNKMDCSGLIVYALKKMGFKIPDNLTAKELASGKLPWILLSDTDNSEQGEPGVLNFYKFGNTTVVHVNVGVGKIGNEEENQVVDASASGTQWQGARNRAPGNRQSPNAQAGKVNKTWAPFSTNHTPDVQARIQWENLKEAEE